MRIDELRSTLHDRAEDVDGGHVAGGHVDRIGSVRARVRTARARRRTSVAVAAVAAVAVAGIVPALRTDDGPSPVDQVAPDRLAGLTVPATETAAGFTYRYVRGVQSAPGADELTYELPRSDRPLLVMWASSDPDPELRLRDRGVGIDERSLTPGFDRFTYLPGDAPHRLVLTGADAPQDARLALAVYEMTDRMPAGTGNDEVWFRREVLDNELLGARVSEPGATRIAFDFTVPDGPISFSNACYGGHDAAQHMLDIQIDGTPLGASGCAQEPVLDAGTGTSTWSATEDLTPGSRVRLTASLVDLETHEPVGDPETVLALGVYAKATDTVQVAGWDVPVRQEIGGHEFVHEESHEATPGARRLVVRLQPVDYPRLVTTVTSGAGTGTTEVSLQVGEQDGAILSMSSGSGAAMGSDHVVQPGTAPTLTLEVLRGDAPTLRLGLTLARMVG